MSGIARNGVVIATVFGLVAFCTAGGLLAHRAYSVVPKGPPAYLLKPSTQRIVAEPGVRSVHATYQVTNSGGSDLILGDVRTTCGCSVASIEPKVLRPGQIATVSVDGHPPDGGQTTVQILVQTNARPHGELILYLTMIGTKRVPYVAVDSGAVHFGEIGTKNAQENVFIETVEKSSDAPWITRASSSTAAVAVRGGLEREQLAGDGTVHRRYAYVARLTELPAVGALHGELLFFTGEPRAAPIRSIPFRGSVRPPVFSIPSSLYVTWDRAERSPSLTLVLAASDRDFPLKAEPASNNPDSVAVQSIERVPGRNVFVVSLRKPIDGSLNTKLNFTTNHPDHKQVQVPLMVSLSSRN